MDEQAENLTPLELKIMRCLQENGRLSNAELAKLVGISTSSCWNHTQRLFKIGAILDVRARINPGMVQRETIVLVGVVLDRSTPDSFQAFEQAAGDLENVLECYLVAGEVDYFLKFVLKIWLLLTVFIVKIIALPGVRQVRTFLCSMKLKQMACWHFNNLIDSDFLDSAAYIVEVASFKPNPKNKMPTKKIPLAAILWFCLKKLKV